MILVGLACRATGNSVCVTLMALLLGEKSETCGYGLPFSELAGVRAFPMQYPVMGRRERQLCMAKSQHLSQIGNYRQGDEVMF